MNEKPMSSNAETSAHLHARLRWACRRGMLELDYFLLSVVDNLYDQLSPAEQQCFQRLLQENDQDLYAWLLNQRAPEDPEYRALCERIRREMVAHNQNK